MEFQIVGVQKKEFKADNGEMISGYNLHCTSQNKYVDGYNVDRFFVTTVRLGGYQPMPSDKVDIMFNRYGKVDSVQLLV